jgi:formate-nitrite transporter family protein
MKADPPPHAQRRTDSSGEARKAADRESISARVIYQSILRQGEHELGRTTAALAWSGLAAGLAMGFSLVAKGVLHGHLPEAPWRPLVTGLGYPVGFLIVILASQQLYTENTLTAVVPVLARRTARRTGALLRLWSVVFLCNMLGALLFAWVAAETALFRAEMHEAFRAVSRPSLRGDFWLVLLRGVFAGWLVALMVWMLPAARGESRPCQGGGGAAELVLVAHIVAGAVEVFYLALAGAIPWDGALAGFVLPALLGNTLGGTALVAMLNHAQVTGGTGDL